MPRGGGGSRGGGSHGSRGGGHSRGSSGFGSRSRSSGGRYYGRRRYGRYYGRGGSSCCGLCFCFLFFIIFLGSGLLVLFLPLEKNDSYILAPNETYLLDVGKRPQSLEVDASTSVKSYFFDIIPALSETVDDNLTASQNLFSDDYFYLEVFIKEGSTVLINWDSNVYLDFYLLQGDSRFNNFEEGNSVSSEYETSGNGVINQNYAFEKSDWYYFIWENLEYYTANLNYDFSFVFTEYSTTGAETMKAGSYDLVYRDQEYQRFIILKNQSPSSNMSFSYKRVNNPFLSVQSLYLIIPGIFIFIGICVKLAKGRKSRNSSMSVGTPGLNSSEFTETYDSSMYGRPQGTKPPVEENLYASHSSNVCPSCQTPIDEEMQQIIRNGGTAYCKNCGARINHND